MADWYRNTDWDAEIEAGFEAKLARTRGQRAQYLRIQGSTLKNSHPEVAIRLLRRCVEAGEPMVVAHALLDTAHAHYRLGDIDAALDTLEDAIAQQRREPCFGTSAAFDLPFLVALHGRRNRYDRAMELLEVGDGPLFPVMAFEREAARAIILSERGEHQQARIAAAAALRTREEQGWIPGYSQVGTVPATEHPLFDRLRTIAGQLG